MNSTGFSNAIEKLFAGANIDELTFELIQTSLESLINSELDEKVLSSVSKYLTKIPENNFGFFESSALTMNTKEKISCVRIPTIIFELTDGGRLSVSNKIKLGNYIKNWYLESQTFSGKKYSKVLIDTKSMKNGRIMEEQIPVLRYTREDLIYLLVLTWKFIKPLEFELAY
ncbi:hypothetical protein ma65 [Moumouvirus australiensis]|uniref:Uncharacterized protein n=1 Tax=Moumouvirus australiensis TaxID=2109587 RepID=A0A2P1EKN2_9VIRU|nr:hypothetical protein QKC55_gp838 [Moumouvirus australiensis]AVL94452.1 hypothetical protein ma65 [Moumouvirus australiensis]